MPTRISLVTILLCHQLFFFGISRADEAEVTTSNQSKKLAIENKAVGDNPPSWILVELPSISKIADSAVQLDRKKTCECVMKIVGAVIANEGQKELQQKDSFIWTLSTVVVAQIRDELIESAIKDVFPQLTNLEQQSIRRTICLSLDNKLTKADWNRSLVRDRLLESLRKSHSNTTLGAKVSDLVERVIVAHQGR